MKRNKYAAILKSPEMPSSKNLGQWIAYVTTNGKRKVLVSDDKIDNLIAKAKKRGKKLDEITISFNNKENAICAF